MPFSSPGWWSTPHCWRWDLDPGGHWPAMPRNTGIAAPRPARGHSATCCEKHCIVSLDAGAQPQWYVCLHDGGRIRSHQPHHMNVDLRFVHGVLVCVTRGVALVLPADVGLIGPARIRRFRQDQLRHDAVGQRQFVSGRWCCVLATQKRSATPEQATVMAPSSEQRAPRVPFPRRCYRR